MRYLVILLVIMPLVAHAVPVGSKRIKSIKTVPLRDRDYGYPRDEDGNEIIPKSSPVVEKEEKEAFANPSRKSYKENSTYNSSKSGSKNWDFYDEFYSTDFPTESGKDKKKSSGSGNSNVWGY